MKAPVKTLETKPAGDNHQVATVKGGSFSTRRTPCATCPWRRDAVGEFPPEAFRLSANTGAVTLDGEGWGNAGAEERLKLAQHTFGCHSSGPNRPTTCAGYVLQKGERSIGWRIALIQGKFNLDAIDDAGLDLFDDYYEMAVANGVPEDDPAIAKCKSWSSDHR